MKAPLLTVGMACLAASAVLTSVVGSLQTREEKLGAGLVQILCALTGIILIILHFILRRKVRYAPPPLRPPRVVAAGALGRSPQGGQGWPDDADVPAVESVGEEQGARRRRSRAVPCLIAAAVVGGILFLAGGLAIGFWLARQQTEVPPAAPAQGNNDAAPRDAIRHMVLSPDGATLASTDGGALTLWIPAARGCRPRVRLPLAEQTPVAGLAFAPDGRWLAVGHADGTVVLRDPATGAEGRRLALLADPARRNSLITCLAFAPGGKTLAAGCDVARPGGWPAGQVIVWDVEKDRQVRAWPTNAGGVKALAFTPVGGTLATAGGDRILRLWEGAAFQQGVQFGGEKGTVMALAFHPDGTRLAAADEEGILTVWGVPGGLSSPLQGHKGAVLSVVYSADGKLLASGGADGTARLWDTAALRQSAAVGRRGGDPVRAVALSKDSALLFAAAGARIEVWETARLLRRQP
jgi:WD40 repeat protein